MCEYCGCQALSVISRLTEEHDRVVALISRTRTAHARGDVDTMATLARRISTVLGPHTAVEEQGLFPAMAGEFPDHVAELTDQHRRIDAVLHEAAAGTPPDGSWPERLMRALHLLRDHILAEQDGVFPAALATLDDADWAAVEAVRAGVGNRAPSAT